MKPLDGRRGCYLPAAILRSGSGCRFKMVFSNCGERPWCSKSTEYRAYCWRSRLLKSWRGYT
jgi:hypothetical protein